MELKPCPFCGSEAAILCIEPYYYVECEKCTATFTVALFSEADAAEAWNRRVGEEETT